MKKIAVVGSLSCDLVLKVPRPPQKGETIIGSSFDIFVGGKGNNQALAAARSGASVSMIGRIGTDSFGDRVLAMLVKTGVDTTYLIRDTEVGTGIADIYIDTNGDNYIAIAQQANGRLCPADVDAARKAIEESSYLLLQLEIPLPTAIHAARLAHSLGKTVVLNPAPAPADGKIPDEFLSLVDIIIPNQTETELLTGIKVVDTDSAVQASKALQKKGLKQVIITMGELGALLVDEKDVPHMVPAFKVEVQDTTAAGDAFCGGLLAAMADGKDLEEAMTYGCAAGALAATRLGAEPSLPTLAEVQELVKIRQTCPSKK
jgi:ribokinase